MAKGVVNGFDNTNYMLWKLGSKSPDDGIYIATTKYPYIHEIDPDKLFVKKKLQLNQLTLINAALFYYNLPREGGGGIIPPPPPQKM